MSARRFGGAFSPGASRSAHGVRTKWSDRAIRSVSLRVILLYMAPLALIPGMAVALVRADAMGLVTMGAAYGLIVFGARLTRDGLAAAAAYEARAVARPPAFPRKLFGAAAVGLGTLLCFLRATGSPMEGVMLGVLAAGLHAVSFGLDPMRAKGLDGLDPEALDAAITRVETARALIADMTAAARDFEDTALSARVGTLAATAGEVIAWIEKDPRELRRARRFLAVYLVGARDATVRFAQLYSEQGRPEIRDKFAALLDDLEAQFNRHRDSLTEDSRTALDVEIDVLRERLRQDGV